MNLLNVTESHTLKSLKQQILCYVYFIIIIIIIIMIIIIKDGAREVG